MSRAAEVELSGAGRKRGKTHITGVHVKKAKSGGYIVHHEREHEDGGSAPVEVHAVPDMEALHDHMEQALGDSGTQGGDDPAAAAQQQEAA